MLPVVIATYVTVLAQIAFPFLLFHRITRRIGLLMLLGMHLSIAVLMGLPFFSGIMASADAVLVSGATWVAIVGWLRTAATDNPVGRRINVALLGRGRRAGEPDVAPALLSQNPARDGAPARQDTASRL